MALFFGFPRMMAETRRALLRRPLILAPPDSKKRITPLLLSLAETILSSYNESLTIVNTEGLVFEVRFSQVRL